MRKIYIMPLIILLNTLLHAQVSGVGIGTSNPQQKLHLASSSGTIRIDGLNSANNAFNGGGIDKTYPVYVNDTGDLTLSLSTFQNSDGSDAITATTPFVTTSLLVPTSATAPNNGLRNLVILPYTITIARDAVLEIKYSISFEVMSTAATKLKSTKARRISTFYTVDTAPASFTSTTPRFGQASKCYHNNNDLAATPVNASKGNMYNSSTTYISLTAGTHTIRFYGEVSTGTTNDQTRVNFAVGNDSVFMRLY
ncbi:hypothetical protein LZZ90_02050 [Flavobacterium sp. SM15]|uniref:hypothetical protein n=1 Tax=Flavobacterium sp. SM15 TaxID=2908005 RepID=UPI001EDB2559|nr:hypothetical protein [Flavobacterium sp. SM15]MCG2610286.1 hypothetical protein [Flavobacterium sp. SM15]